MFEDIMLEVFLCVLSVSVGAVSKAAIEALRKVIEKITSEAFSREVADRLYDAVAATTQTYVDDLKKSGSFDKDAQLHALAMSLSTLLGSLSQGAKDYIQKNFGDAETYLTGQIEAEVKRQKLAAATVPTNG